MNVIESLKDEIITLRAKIAAMEKEKRQKRDYYGRQGGYDWCDPLCMCEFLFPKIENIFEKYVASHSHTIKVKKFN